MFPKPYVVQHYIGTTGGQDSLGNDTPQVADEPIVRRVYSWSARDTEKLDGHTSRDVDIVKLLMPVTDVGMLDQFTLGDVADGTAVLGVDGEPQRFEVVRVNNGSRGFHRWRPGITVELKAVNG